MKIAVLGTGDVGQRIAGALVARGHDVKMGSRSANNEKAAAFVAEHGARASAGSYADAAAFGELVFNCVSGDGTLAALESAGKERLKGKILVDVANPLDFSRGFPPVLSISGHDSLGERVQQALPETKVVKALNTVANALMADPKGAGDGEHTLFVCGNDDDAKATVTRLLRDDFGWRDVLDLGDITAARGTESYLVLWVRLFGALKTPMFNVKVVRAS